MRAIVVGSGLAAVGAIRGLLKFGIRPVVLDIGEQLPPHLAKHQTSMAKRSPADWSRAEWEQLGENDGVPGRVVPRKLVFGSDYFYSPEQADITQMNQEYAGTPPWSPARGGFSAGWGAAVLPPAPSDVADWPISHEELLKNMHEVLNGVPVSEPDDEIGKVFGRLRPEGSEVLQLSPGQATLLARLQRARRAESPTRVLVGQSRLLTQADPRTINHCRFCGHCSSGCVYGSIYTAEHDINRWVQENQIDYRSGVTVFQIHEHSSFVRVRYRVEDRVESLEGDRLFLAAGAVNSARILLNSAPLNFDSIVVRRTGYSIQVFASVKSLAIAWPEVNTQTSHFLTFQDTRISKFWAHAQIAQPNEVILRRLGLRPMSRGVSAASIKQLTSRLLTVALNLHSSLGPTYEMRVHQKAEQLPATSVRQVWSPESRRSIKSFSRTLAQVLRPAGLYAVPFARQNSAAALTYHFGATFPMQRDPRGKFETDALGRPFGWSRVHVVDTSVLPAIPATTVGVLTMANAHRIATHVAER